MEGLDVEFLDGSRPSTPAPRRRTIGLGSIRPPARLQVAAVVLWTVAAGLCAVAVFLNVFTYRIDFSVIHTRGGYNAVGRSLDKELAQDQGPRFAIVLAVVAALFAGLAVAVGRDLAGRGAGRWRRYVPLIGVGTVAFLAGVLACIALWIDASFVSYRSVVGPMSEQQPNALHLTIGGCIWFGLGAFGCGTLALIATIWQQGAGARPDAPPSSEPQQLAPLDCGTPQ